MVKKNVVQLPEMPLNSGIVCDTSVWYHMKNNHNLLPKYTKLIPTAMSLFELCSTGRQNNNFRLVQEVVRTIVLFKKNYIPYFPWSYVASRLYEDYDLSTSTILPIEHALRILSSSELDDLGKRFIEVGQKHENEQLEILKWELSETIKNYDLTSSSSRTRFANDTTIPSSDTITMTTSLIVRSIRDICAIDYQPPIEAVNEEFFRSRTFSFLVIGKWQFLREKTLELNTKLEGNDVWDLLNLAYVGKDNLYWLTEKFYSSLFERRADCFIEYEPPIKIPNGRLFGIV
jgi:hypothetical protein